MARAFPFIAARYPSFRAYGGASIEDLFGPTLDLAREMRINTLESMLFLNGTNGFEAFPLPTEAQFAPGLGLTVGDFNGDGNEDVILAQNFFGTDSDTPRHDAGRGLLLEGDGRGQFAAVSGQESGIVMYGEQRGSAAADYDGDGRVDVCVSQNLGATKLYRNVGGAAGIRIRLRGPAGNPDGVGAVIRGIYGGEPGASREIHAGGGYWSQDSAVQVLAARRAGSALEGVIVRWPGGQNVTNKLRLGERELVLEAKSPAGEAR